MLLPLGLPGGNQVDGLPPAVSMLATTKGNDREVVVTAYAHTLQKVIRIASPWNRDDYRPIHEIGAVFLKNLSFSRTSTIFCEFLLLKIVNTSAHARGFAPL